MELKGAQRSTKEPKGAKRSQKGSKEPKRAQRPFLHLNNLPNKRVLLTYDILDQSDFNWDEIVENMNAVFEINEFSLGHFLGFHAVLIND